MEKLFRMLSNKMNEGTPVVLSTIIQASGSAPRGVGAQMLCDKTGIIAGTIGGGPAEYNSIILSKEILNTKKHLVKEYKLIHTDNNEIDSVCGGNVTVLHQYIDPCRNDWKQLCISVLMHFKNRIPGYLALYEDSAELCTLEVRNEAPENAIIIQLPIKERAIIFGAGHVSVALTKILSTVGFSVTVFDNRSELLTPLRFPLADQLILGDFLNIKNYLNIQPEDYICVLTSGHKSDYDVEFQLLNDNHAYFGVIGSHAKTMALNARLIDNGIPQDCIDTVHTPIGLPIKAVTPEEIAISITAEMIQVRAELRNKMKQDNISCPV